MIRKILIVSNSELAEAIWDVLMLREFEVLTAHSGLEALRIVTPTEFVNLIIADDYLGDMDGLVFTKLLRNQGIDTPVILMVNNPDITDDFYKHLGIAGVLRKPSFDVFALIEGLNAESVN